MGFLDSLLGSVKRPPAGQPVRAAEEVFAALLSVNGPDKPYGVRPGDDGRADVIAEFTVTTRALNAGPDTYWDRGYRILLRLDPERREVRALKTGWRTEWWDGPSRVTVGKDSTRGFASLWGTFIPVERNEEGTLLAMAAIRFDSGELTTLLMDRVLAGGWTWRPIRVFDKL